MPNSALPDRAAVLAAEAVIRRHVRETPIVTVPARDFGLIGSPLTFKLEFMQHSGSFKARGAFTNLLMREGAERGVVAASGGNHGAAVAFAAQQLGYRAKLFVPSIASPAKIARIQSYGADVVVGGAAYSDAFAASRAWAAEHGAMQVHAYDQFETLAGQGTVALEFAEQAPRLDTVLVAVGGGGLIGGMAAYYQGDIRLIGVEPETAPTLMAAMQVDGPIDVAVSGLAVDSLGAKRIGDLAFPLAQKYVDASLLVSDEAIAEAQRKLWDVLRVVVEPGGATAFAALLSGRYVPEAGERVGVLLCGANTTVVNFG